MDTLVSVQALLTATIELLDRRADLLTGEDEPEALTEQRALFNMVKGIHCLVENQVCQANASS